MVRELAHELCRRRPGARADPGAAGGALHDGRHPHRHRHRDAAARAVRRRRMRLRVDQRRQPARLQLAGRDPGVRRPRRPRRGGVRQGQSGRRASAAGATAPRPRRRASARCSCARTAARRVAGLRKAMNDTMESGAGIYRTERIAAGDLPACSPSCARATQRSQLRRPQQRVQHRSDPGPGAGLHAARSPRRWRIRRCSARSRAARTSASIIPERDDDNYLRHSLATYRGAEPPAIELLRRGDHPLAAGRARLWGSRRMSETVTLEVLRYRPETDSEPHFQTYTVPYNEDWVVLDALNHIKDHLDGTLSYRWSCHMAVCGSCGMMINGEPKLVVPRLPARLPRRRDPDRAARSLPDRARPGRSSWTASWRSCRA